MFVIELIYKADLSEIDAHMRGHVSFLKKYYASGNFLVSGRKIPRDGGIILALVKSLGKSKPSSKKIRFASIVWRTFASSNSAPANGRTTFQNGSRRPDQQSRPLRETAAPFVRLICHRGRVTLPNVIRRSLTGHELSFSQSLKAAVLPYL